MREKTARGPREEYAVTVEGRGDWGYGDLVRALLTPPLPHEEEEPP